MGKTTDTTTSRPHTPEEFRWCVAYLRENIQDLRNEIRYVNRRIDDRFEATNRRFDDRFEATNRRFDDRFEATNQRIEATNHRSDGRFAATNRRSYESYQTSNQYSDETFERLLRRLDIHTTVFIVTMFVLTGVAIAIIKL